MKFIYACDIHGDVNKYNELFEVAIKSRIKYMVWGGDLLPKKGGSKEEVQPAFIGDFFEKYIKKLKTNGIELIFIMGNDDLEIFDEKIEQLCKKYSNIHNINKSLFENDEFNFIGLSNVLDNPFRYKNRVVMENGLEMEPQLSDKLWVNKDETMLSVEEWKVYRETKLAKMDEILSDLPSINNNKKTIYVFHSPPFGIGLDVCKGGYKAGSKDILHFLKNSNAYMSFHGHIHESPTMSGMWYNRIGNTICIQPGQTESGKDEMIYVIVDTEKNIQERFTKTIRL